MRKVYLDNIRWFVILMVLVFHAVSTFCSNGSLMSYNFPGIPALDAIGYLLYPWFMPCMFVVAGISAQYSLAKKTSSQFVKDRVMRLLLPFISYLVLIGPLVATLSFEVNNLNEVFSALPPVALFFVRVVNGMGPSWFLLQLFVVSLVLVLVRRLDRADRLYTWAGKCGLGILLLLYIPVLGAAQVLYIAYTFRVGLYLLLFLLGYYLFSQENIQRTLQTYSPLLLAGGIVLGIVQTYMSWGRPFQQVVNHWLVMLYTWIMILAVLGAAGRWFNRSNTFTAYMTKRSYGLYYFHYVPMTYIAYWLTTGLALPYIWNYVLVLVLSLIASIVLYEIFSRIPVLNVLFGLKKVKE
ncbi:acyltransferase family protein [Breznakiella homolactica]|uniref:Acyltransferase n=1 Tax=Breznakiella homolactica TaxID=2798577 RepID=A0A7T8B7T5_9SPIR|nr:acyltransferase [Breznakiella homolactica]QQO07864.1 acyltransferase [Breznakiella homolactica]